VGIGLLYLQPVGYADVTESWIKPAGVRATVALGGILFQAVPLLGVAAAWIVTQHHLLGAYALASLAGIALNLVPFVRLDGYWLLCHLLDQQNLRQRSLEHLRYLADLGQPWTANRLLYLDGRSGQMFTRDLHSGAAVGGHP
jgi:putative peptide zinc metalloprotease protein